MALLVPLVVLVLFWALVLLPQRRRVRAHAVFVSGLDVGAEVITTAGIHGSITAVDDDVVRLRVAPDVELTIARPAIARLQSDDAPNTSPSLIEPAAVPDDADGGSTPDPAPSDPTE